MKKTICLIVVITLIASCFVGCNKEPAPSQTEPTEAPVEKLEDKVFYDGELYSLERIDGQCYVNIKDISILKTRNELLNEEEPTLNLVLAWECLTPLYLDFQSMDELVKTVSVDGMSLEQLSILHILNESANGKIKVFDFEKIPYPVMPDGYEFSSITWHGQSYSLYATKQDAHPVSITVHLEETYKKEIKENIDDLEGSDVIETDEATGVTSYFHCATGRHDMVDKVFSFDSDDFSYTVKETYSDVTKANRRINVYGESDDMYFTLYISSLESSPEREWYSQFKLAPYKAE